MSIIKGIKITGTGKYLPSRIISSEEIESNLELPAGWSVKHSGVRERRRAVNESNADMAVKALCQAMNYADIAPGNLDMLISSAVTHDYILPFQAALVLKQLPGGNEINIPAMDINASCLSFITAFDVAVTLLDGDKYKRIAIVSSEIASIGLNPCNKEIFTLFGDGAAAVILEKDEENHCGLIRSLMRMYPEGFDYSIIKGGGNMFYYKDYDYDPNLFSFNMDGRQLLRLAKHKVPLFFDEFFSGLEIGMNDVDVIIPHQASKMGLELFFHQYPDTRKTVYSNLETHGNCIAASIPMCLHDVIEKGLLTREKHCLLAGTAAGFGIGAILIKY